ncbi:hypothetical protein Peur_036645 [Populus x canadensis]
MVGTSSQALPLNMATTHRTLFSWSKPFPTSFHAVFHVWLTRNEVIYNDGRLDQCGLWSLIYNSQQGCSLGTEVFGRALFCYTGDALLRSPDCVKSVSALKWNTDGIRYKWSTIKDHELIYSSSILTGTNHSNETEILAIKKAVEISADHSSLAQTSWVNKRSMLSIVFSTQLKL